MLTLEKIVGESSKHWWPKLTIMEKRFSIIPVGKVNRINYLKRLKNDMLNFENELMNIFRPLLANSSYTFQFKTEEELDKLSEAVKNNNSQNNKNEDRIHPVHISTQRFSNIITSFKLPLERCPVCRLKEHFYYGKICPKCGTVYDFNFFDSTVTAGTQNINISIKIIELYNHLLKKICIPDLIDQDIFFIRNDKAYLKIIKSKDGFNLIDPVNRIILIKNVDAVRLIRGLNIRL